MYLFIILGHNNKFLYCEFLLFPVYLLTIYFPPTYLAPP